MALKGLTHYVCFNLHFCTYKLHNKPNSESPHCYFLIYTFLSYHQQEASELYVLAGLRNTPLQV